MSIGHLAPYLVTQSNVIAAVEQGDEVIEDGAAWLRDEVEPLFLGPKEIFGFRGTIWFLRND